MFHVEHLYFFTQIYGNLNDLKFDKNIENEFLDVAIC